MKKATICCANCIVIYSCMFLYYCKSFLVMIFIVIELEYLWNRSTINSLKILTDTFFVSHLKLSTAVLKHKRARSKQPAMLFKLNQNNHRNPIALLYCNKLNQCWQNSQFGGKRVPLHCNGILEGIKSMGERSNDVFMYCIDCQKTIFLSCSIGFIN